ncbi:peroxiredoxin [Sulfolobales archaeon HS-7]|nr:peroxiredoxin [Sulfolobales archaeon HS-7]
MLREGDIAPDFEGITDSGDRIRLYSLLEKSPVVLYFYPKDDTPGCTKEACTFRDNWERISQYGATVIGVSSDSEESHKQFKRKYGLQFILISDKNSKIREIYGVKGFILPPRVTFVINSDKRIVRVFNSQTKPERHVQIAIETLKAMK